MSRPRRARRTAAGAALGLALTLLLAPSPTSATSGSEGTGSEGTGTEGTGTEVQQTWHADQARVPAARAAGRSGAGVVVAVLDSWVDGRHPDFEGRVLPGADCVQGVCVPGPARADACDHGTHVAGTVASSSFGIAPQARVLPVRVLAFDAASGECLGDPDDVAAGIRWAVAQGARVLNLSLGPDVPGLTASSALPVAVQEAAAAGALVVFSAGNARLPLADSYSGAALVVAATGPDGQLASYSQRSLGVDLAAPGGDPVAEDRCTREDCVTSLYPADRYAVAAGTSMAAPHVSGVAALLLGQDGTRTREQLVARLTGTARPLAEAGAGVLDASAALDVRARQAPVPAAAAAPSAASPRPLAAAARSGRRAPRPSTAAPVAPRPAAPPDPAVTRAPAAPVQAPVRAPAEPLPVPVALPAAPEQLPAVPVRAAVALVALAAAGTLTVARRTASGLALQPTVVRAPRRACSACARTSGSSRSVPGANTSCQLSSSAPGTRRPTMRTLPSGDSRAVVDQATLEVTRSRTTSGRVPSSTRTSSCSAPLPATSATSRTRSRGRSHVAVSTSRHSSSPARPGSSSPDDAATTGAPASVSAHAARRSPAGSGTSRTASGRGRRRRSRFTDRA